MITLSIFSMQGFTLFLLWASLVVNIVLLMWIWIHGNAAKILGGVLKRQAETTKYNSELSKELLKEMSAISHVNELLRKANDEQTKVILQSDQWVLDLLYEMWKWQKENAVFERIKKARGWDVEHL